MGIIQVDAYLVQDDVHVSMLTSGLSMLVLIVVFIIMATMADLNEYNNATNQGKSRQIRAKYCKSWKGKISKEDAADMYSSEKTYISLTLLVSSSELYRMHLQVISYCISSE